MSLLSELFSKIGCVGDIMNRTIELRVAELPDVLWSLCHQLADVLREAAEDEDPHTRERLLELAATFEAGGREVEWPEQES